jgi:hypothetical protein
MPQIENTMYNYCIEAVIDGYFFEPIAGQINVIKDADLYIKDIKNKTFKSNVVKTDPKKIKTTPKIEKKPDVEESIKINPISDIIKKIKDNSIDEIVAPIKLSENDIKISKILKEENKSKSPDKIVTKIVTKLLREDAQMYKKQIGKKIIESSKEQIVEKKVLSVIDKKVAAILKEEKNIQIPKKDIKSTSVKFRKA